MRLPWSFASWLVVASSIAVIGPGHALAQDDTALARAAFERGREAYESGAFEDALTAFQRAYELTGDAQILFNVATVADRLRRDELALEAYEGYLAGYPDAPDRANVEGRIRAIRASRAGVEASPVVASGPDPEPMPASVEDRTSSEGDASEGESRDASDASEGESRNASEGGLVLAIAGGILALGGGALLIATAVEIESASNAETWAELMGPYDRVPILSAAGVIALSLGGAIAAVGIGWIVSSGSSDEPSVALRVGPGSLSLTGSF